MPVNNGKVAIERNYLPEMLSGSVFTKTSKEGKKGRGGDRDWVLEEGAREA